MWLNFFIRLHLILLIMRKGDGLRFLRVYLAVTVHINYPTYEMILNSRFPPGNFNVFISIFAYPIN